MRALAIPAAAAGGAAATLHFAGALKSLPGLGRLPVDLTLVAAAVLLPALAALALDRRWRLDRTLALPLAAAAALPLWAVVGASWSSSGAVAAEKLIQMLGLGLPLLLAGLLVGADPRARAGLCGATLLIGTLVGAGIAFGLAADLIVLGGRVGADPERVRVQYQIAGLAIACAGGLAAIRLVEARGPAAWLFWAAATAGFGVAVLLPGGRLALLGLGLAVVLAPALRLGLAGRAGAGALWVGAAAAATAGGLALLLAAPERASSLYTLERAFGGPATATPARALLWADAWAWAGATLPFGLGPGGFNLAAGFGEARGFYPHNHALEALAEGGLPGLALWLGAFGGGVVVAAARARTVGGARAARIAALTLPLALTAMVSTDLGNRMVWFGLGLLLSLAVEARAPDG